MEKEKTSNFGLSLIWLGAAISIAEISTGVLFAPLGIREGIGAVLLGHAIGAIILYMAGIIGGQSGLSSTMSTCISFGRYGGCFFSVLNVLQLVGWTAVMIISGASALDALGASAGFGNYKLWCVIIGGLIILWIVMGLKNLEKVNIVAVTALFILCVILGVKAFTSAPLGNEQYDVISFGAAVELSVAMPLSWLPLIADYTRDAKNPIGGSLVSTITYTLGSCFMYIIGLGAAVFAGTSDISSILLASGLGTIALIIILFSTVTTTFLDAFSAGVSSATINRKVNEKHAAVVTTIIGIILALFVSMDQYENFLYLIGSVFAPLFAILFADYFIFHITEVDEKCRLNVKNTIIWILGFIAYRYFMTVDFVLGVTLPVMAGITFVCIICGLVEEKIFKKHRVEEI